MYYYFTSQTDCALKLNGIYLGVITGVTKHVDIISDNSLVEFVPLNSNLPLFSFTINSDFLRNPPDQVLLTDMKGGYLIVYNPTITGLPFKIIEQQKLENMAVTVFSDVSYKISIQTNSDFFTQSINFNFDTVEIIKRNDFLLVAFNGKQSVVYCYKLFPKITCITYLSCSEFSFDNFLTTFHEYLDVAKHKVTITWDFNGDKLVPKNKKICRSQNFSVSNLPAKIIPYAFLEELYVGGDIDCYLASNIKPNSDKLRGFFGEFIGIMPPPFFVSPEQIGLIYKQSSNRYYVEYCSFELNGRLISGIKK